MKKKYIIIIGIVLILAIIAFIVWPKDDKKDIEPENNTSTFELKSVYKDVNNGVVLNSSGY